MITKITGIVMNRFLLILFLGLFAVNVQSQSKIIFSRSAGKLNSGATIDLMVYNPSTKKIKMLYKGSVQGRGEYGASTSPNNSQLLVNTYLFGGWKLGIADFSNGKISNLRRFTKRSNYEYNAKWSHNGSLVAYEEFSWNSRDMDLFIANKNGENVKQFTNAKGGDLTPHWTRDDKSIVFTSDRIDNYDIYIKLLDGGVITNLSNHSSNDYAPSTSGVNDKIAFISDRKGVVSLFTMKYDGTNLTNLTPGLSSKINKSEDFENSGYWAYQTSWSPDGKQIVFSVLDGLDLEIFIIDSDGKNLTQITDNEDSDLSPFWIN